MIGVDLLPYLNHNEKETPHEALFWLQGHQEIVLHRGMKLIRAQQPRKLLLFDLAADPIEQFNLGNEHPETVKRLKAKREIGYATLGASTTHVVKLDQCPQLIEKHGEQTSEIDDEYIYWPN